MAVAAVKWGMKTFAGPAEAIKSVIEAGKALNAMVEANKDSVNDCARLAERVQVELQRKAHLAEGGDPDLVVRLTQGDGGTKSWFERFNEFVEKIRKHSSVRTHARVEDCDCTLLSTLLSLSAGSRGGGGDASMHAVLS